MLFRSLGKTSYFEMPVKTNAAVEPPRISTDDVEFAKLKIMIDMSRNEINSLKGELLRLKSSIETLKSQQDKFIPKIPKAKAKTEDKGKVD